MLSSIHPFGERSRNNSFWLTATAHIVGSVIGGMVLGLAAGLVGWATTFVVDGDSTLRAAAFALFAFAATAIEATGNERSLPTRLHQVDENWIQMYRGWVYGGGFGIELGFGLSTIITTALVHVTVAAMVLVGSVPAALLIGAIFGLMRGLPLVGARHVDSPEALRSLHRQLDATQHRSRQLGVAALALSGLIGLAAVVT